MTGYDSAVILPNSALNASVPASLLNMLAASAKLSAELTRNDAATR